MENKKENMIIKELENIDAQVAKTKDGSRNYLRLTMWMKTENKEIVKVKCNLDYSEEQLSNLENIAQNGWLGDIHTDNLEFKTGTFKGQTYEYFEITKDQIEQYNLFEVSKASLMSRLSTLRKGLK